MKPLAHVAHALLLAYTFARADHLPPLREVVVENIEAIETVTVEGDFPEVYFIDRVQGRLCYIDSRFFGTRESLPHVERVAGEWRMTWYDRRDECYRVVYAPKWLLSDVPDWSHTPKFEACGLRLPTGRWW